MIILMLLFSSLSIAQVPSAYNCEFYNDMEQIKNCSSTRHSYLVDYGYHYCKKFSKLQNTNKDHKELYSWISKTKLCLQEMIQNRPRVLEVSCKDLEDFAFETHSICYNQSGICNLRRADFWKVMRTINVQHYFSASSVFSNINIGLKCLFTPFNDEIN